MARPLKQGIEYFSHDTDSWDDPKIKALRKKHGNDGYAFYFHFLELIYKSKNYEFPLDDEIMITIISDDLNLSEEKFFEILDTCFRFKLFDSESYKNNKLVTSFGVKKRAENIEKYREKRRNYYRKKENYQNEVLDVQNEVLDVQNEVLDVQNEVLDVQKGGFGLEKVHKGKKRKEKERKEKKKEEKEGKEKEKKSPPSQRKIIEDFLQENLKKKLSEIKEIIRQDFSYSDLEIENIILSWFLTRKGNNWQTKAKNPIKIRADNMLDDLIRWFAKEFKPSGTGKSNGKSIQKIEKINKYFGVTN